VAIVVLSSDGRLLVHRRADHKDLYPGWWDLTAGGVVAAGETYADAAPRELAEELGISDATLTELTVARFDNDHAREICHIFHTVHDGPFHFDDGEIDEARWVTPDQLSQLVATQRFLPGSMAMILPALSTESGRFALATDRIRCDAVQRVEFTVEPFVEGQPGRHVTAPIDAVRALGVEVEFGPFGSECVTPADRSSAVVAAIVDSAFENGATHVTIDITRFPEP